ncbi:MAG: Methyltransferase type 11 [Pedosphaera sp.]|nr:Methyltransferase type 11 [Pedosphaera sp.]
MSIRINLGCGPKYFEGYINCDFNPRVKADKYFDLETFPYPLEANLADEIILDNVLEHLNDVPRVMDELHRILKVGGVLKVMLPYAKSDWALQDPTHKHFFTERTLEYFCEGFAGINYYAKEKFRMLKAELTADNYTYRHRLRNMIPFRNSLRYFLFNMYDGVYYELQKI